MTKDLYKTLEISPDASYEEIKKSFRRIAMLCHPDRHMHNPHAEEQFKEINYAYSILIDEEKRGRYDLYREFLNYSDRMGISLSGYHEKILEDLLFHTAFPGFGKIAEDFFGEQGPFHRLHPLFTLSKSSILFFQRISRFMEKEPYLSPKEHFSRLRSLGKGFRKKTEGPFRAYKQKKSKRPVFNGSRPTEFQEKNGKVDFSRVSEEDIEWILPLTVKEATEGLHMQLSFAQGPDWERILLRVPSGIKNGMRLRVKNKGHMSKKTGKRGDIYFCVSIR